GPTAYYDMFLEGNENKNKETIMAIQHLKSDYPNTLMIHTLPGSVGGWSSINSLQSLVDAYETWDGKIIDDPTSGYDPNKPFENRDPRLYMTVRVPGNEFNGGYFDPYNPNTGDFYNVAVGPNSGYGVMKYSEVIPNNDFNNGANVIVFRL